MKGHDVTSRLEHMQPKNLFHGLFTVRMEEIILFILIKVDEWNLISDFKARKAFI